MHFDVTIKYVVFRLLNVKLKKRKKFSSQRTSVASVVPSSPILVTMMKEALSASEM
jgi:hypothetical protein